jgi:hypothetical protein
MRRTMLTVVATRSLNSDGSSTTWRYHEVYSCEGFQVSASYQYQSESGWVNVQCPTRA